MSYIPILEDLTALGDELAEIGDAVLTGAAVKAGARNSAADAQTIQEIAEAASDILDLAIELGAAHPDGEDEPTEAAISDDALKAMYDDPIGYAQHECQDIAGGCQALQALAMLMQSELSEDYEEDEEGTIAKLASAMRSVVEFIASEIDAIEESKAGETKAQRTFGGKERDDLEDEDFAGPDRSYPIMTAKDVKDAARLIGKAKDPDAVKKRIIAIAKKKGFEDALPPFWAGATKGIEFISDELAVCPGYSVKAVAGDEGLVSGYLVKFGGAGDLSQWRDIFTPETDFGRHTKTDVWVHHRMLPGLGKRKLTNQADIGTDDVGVFIKHLLDLRDPYEKALYGLTGQGKLGWSSGTAPHLVDRKAIDGGRHEITQWILGVDASYTPTPAGGLEVNASAMKSLFDEAGLDLLAALYDDTETKADDRQRAILIELGLLELDVSIPA